MGIISVEQADHLYWLGRYTERVYTTLKIFSKRFDALIDGAKNGYEEFCKSIDIPNIYADKADFIKEQYFLEVSSTGVEILTIFVGKFLKAS